jgi:hypothetical protein
MAIRHRGTIGIPTDGFSGLWTALFWLAAFGAGGYGVYWAIGSLKHRADSEVETNAPKAMAAHRRELAGSDTPRKSPPAFPVREAKPELDRAGAEVNILTLSKEAARLKGDSVTQMEHATAAAHARARFSQLAAGESVIPELLEPRDEVLGVDDMDFARVKPESASIYISRAISRIPPGTFMKVRVRRGNERDVILYFGAASGTGMVVAAPGRIKISNEFALEIQKQVLSLPPDQLLEYERKQIEKILGIGEATDEEYAMLIRKVTGAASDSAAAKGMGETFTRQIQRLEGFLPKAPVPEAIVMKDGRRFSGKLLAETPAAVSVRTVVGDITVPKDDVAQIVTANDLRAEFASKLGAGQKYRDALLQLIIWTREMNMPVHRELVAYTILQTTPSDPFARNAAGYVQMDGVWTLKGSIAAGAPIPERKAETKDEIRQELESMGFVLRGEKWFSKAPWSTGLDTLYQPGGLKIGLNGTAVMDWHEADTPIYRRDEKPKKLGGLDLKFIAPTGAQGLAKIEIEAPGEILECQVKACGYIMEEKPPARIECFLTAEGGKSQVLYDIPSKADFNFHDVTLYVRGKTKFSVTARLITVQDKYHTYARFLPSNKDTSQTFWVKGVVLKPASEFDRLWAGAK